MYYLSLFQCNNGLWTRLNVTSYVHCLSCSLLSFVTSRHYSAAPVVYWPIIVKKNSDPILEAHTYQRWLNFKTAQELGVLVDSKRFVSANTFRTFLKHSTGKGTLHVTFTVFKTAHANLQFVWDGCTSVTQKWPAETSWDNPKQRPTPSVRMVKEKQVSGTITLGATQWVISFITRQLYPRETVPSTRG